SVTPGCIVAVCSGFTAVAELAKRHAPSYPPPATVAGQFAEQSRTAGAGNRRYCSGQRAGTAGEGGGRITGWFAGPATALAAMAVITAFGRGYCVNRISGKSGGGAITG